MQTQTQGTGKVDRDAVEDLGGITVLRGGGEARGWNGIHYQQGLSAKNVGSTALSGNVPSPRQHQAKNGEQHTRE
jgi:hypothetical protein